MTVVYLGDGIYKGLSGDTKPTSGVSTGAIFIETDTKKLFTFSGGSWTDEALTIYADDLQDVVITSPLYKQVIGYDGQNFVNIDTAPAQDYTYKAGEWYPIASSDLAIGIISDNLTADGTITRSNDATGRSTKFETGAADTVTVGLRQTTSYYRREFNSRFLARYQCLTCNSNTRVFYGFSSSSTALATDTPFDSGVSGIVVAIRVADNGTGVTMKVLHNDSSGSTVVADTGINHDSNSSRHSIEIALSSTNAKVYVDGQLTNTITSDLPATTTDLFPHWEVQRNGGSAKSMQVYKALVITK